MSSERVALMEDTLAKWGLELSAYIGGLDSQEIAIIQTITGIMALAFITDMSSRLIKPVKNVEDPIQVVLSQPVGAQEARRRSVAPMSANPPVASPTQCRISQPSQGMPSLMIQKPDEPHNDIRKPIPSREKPNPKKNHNEKTNISKGSLRLEDSEAERQHSTYSRLKPVASPEEAMMPSAHPPADEAGIPKSDTPREHFISNPTARKNVLAEIDYIRGARREDITSLKSAFGTIFVPKRSYVEASTCLKSKGIVCEGILTALEAEADGEIYECITLAQTHDAIILTDSANIRRICQKREIPCWDSKEWELMAPTPG
jgi:hypothetical protein